MGDALQFLQPEHFLAPRGYSNGVFISGERASKGLIIVGGQIGWNAEQQFTSDEFCPQFAQALRNVIDVVQAGGARAQDIASMTIYVTDMDAYRSAGKALGAIWRESMGNHYPAMALLGVASLVEPRALVEIQAVAALARGK